MQKVALPKKKNKNAEILKETIRTVENWWRFLKIPDAENRDWAMAMQSWLQMAERERFIKSVFSTVQHALFLQFLFCFIQ